MSNLSEKMQERLDAWRQKSLPVDPNIPTKDLRTEFQKREQDSWKREVAQNQERRRK